MKKAKKVVLTLLCALLLIACSVAGTLAYLTSQDSVTNTFTVGKVVITLDESKVDEYGKVQTGEDPVKANAYKLIPGHKYTKDPTIHVEAGSEACYLFVKVENGLANIEADTTIEAQILAKGWTKLTGVDGVNNVYYKLQDAVSAGGEDVDVPVFDSFTLKDNADVATYGTAKIIVTAYAVQQDGLEVNEAWAAIPTT